MWVRNIWKIAYSLNCHKGELEIFPKIAYSLDCQKWVRNIQKNCLPKSSTFFRNCLLKKSNESTIFERFWLFFIVDSLLNIPTQKIIVLHAFNPFLIFWYPDFGYPTWHITNICTRCLWENVFSCSPIRIICTLSNMPARLPLLIAVN